MGQIVSAMASSHTYAFIPPEQWEERRQMTKASYARRYGVEPPDQPQVAEENPEENRIRYQGIWKGLTSLRDRLRALRPDALVLVGDDQDEHFREPCIPQFAIYIGDEFVIKERESGTETRYRCSTELAWAILTRTVEAGFDMGFSRAFPNNQLISHAHHQVLNFLDPEGQVAVVLLFVNAIHVPGPSPARCYQLGKQLKQVVESLGDSKRVVFYASGGLSHFTAGYPYRHYRGPHTLGAICREYDRKIVEAMRQGKGADLTRLSSQDLLENGEPEFRNWLVVLGAIGKKKPEFLVYEPFYRAVMGMAVSYWELES
jgi:aromatic ring-opening dioxygenase LigB subunit